MTLCKPHDLRNMCPPQARLLGLDLGRRSIGLALSDVTWTIASPFGTLKRQKFTLDREVLFHLLVREGVGGLVLGLPVNMDGTEGSSCQSVRSFAQNLTDSQHMIDGHHTPIVLWDERTSTQAVTRTLLDADTSRSRRKDLVDKMAASFILQGFLDYLRHA